MPSETAQILRKKKNQIVNSWIKYQIADANFRSDFVSQEEVQAQSEELVDKLLNGLSAGDFTNIAAASLDPVVKQLAIISAERVRQGYTPRETGMFVISLKEALVEALSEELEDERAILFQ